MITDTLKDSLPFNTSNKKMCDKINKINILKDNFYSLINKYFEYITFDNDINSYLNNYKELYQFSKVMKIYEYNKWNKIKLDYINIKKKLTLYKKLYSKIIKNYADIINYFNQDEISTINDKINFLQNKNDKINYNYAILCQKYLEIIINRKSLIKNKKVIKINNFEENNDILPDIKYSIEIIIKQLYDSYYKMIQLNKEHKILKSTNSSIINEIMKMQKSKLKN
jgi:hypothetical protein